MSASGSGPVAALGDLPESFEEVLLARLAARALPTDVRTRLDAALVRGQDAADAEQRALADAAGLGLVDRGPEAVLLRHRDGAYLELRLRAGALWRVHVYEGAEARAIAERVALRASRAVEAAALRGQGASQAEATLEQRLGTLTPVGTLRRDGVEVRVGRSAIGVGVAVAVEAGTCREVRVLCDDVAERVAAALAT